MKFFGVPCPVVPLLGKPEHACPCGQDQDKKEQDQYRHEAIPYPVGTPLACFAVVAFAFDPSPRQRGQNEGDGEDGGDAPALLVSLKQHSCTATHANLLLIC